MKTINKFTAFLMLILSGVVFMGCNNLEEPQQITSTNDIINEEEETDNEEDDFWVNCTMINWRLKVKIEDKDGNNLLDLTNPDNVIFDVEADEICSGRWQIHYEKANKFTLEDCIKNGYEDMYETMSRYKIFPYKNEEELTSETYKEGGYLTTFHFELCTGMFEPAHEHPIYEYALTLYIGDDWTRTYNITLETISVDNPLFGQYGHYRWIVDGEVLPDDNLTVIK